MRKMEHKCEADGCFLEEHVLKLWKLDDLFPGNIGMSDIDGVVEYKGYFLWLEWKNGASTEIPRGQEIMFERFSKWKYGFVLLVRGKSKQMIATSYAWIHNGKTPQWVDCGDDGLRNAISFWVSRVNSWVK